MKYSYKKVLVNSNKEDLFDLKVHVCEKNYYNLNKTCVHIREIHIGDILEDTFSYTIHQIKAIIRTIKYGEHYEKTIKSKWLERKLSRELKTKAHMKKVVKI